MSIEIIRYKIPQPRADAFRSAYEEAAKILAASSVCQGYELIHGEEEPENWILIIRWTSTEAHLKTFRTSREFPEFFRLVKPFFNDIQEMKHYCATGLSWTP
jgi:quinol monooxygenase YgiN